MATSGPHLPALVIMLVTSMSGIAVAIAIPLVIKALIDGPIEDHDASGILPLGLLVLGLGILEAFLVWLRRWVQNKAVLEVETAMRHDLYERLQELPMSFHSQWQSGQLLSRATTDLSALRRFFGFGMLFLVVNITQVVVTTLVLLHLYWPLGLVVAATAAPIVWLSMRFEKGYVVVSRDVQDQQGDLATLAEEGAVGIRVIKSFGRVAPRQRCSTTWPRGACSTPASRRSGLSAKLLDVPRDDPQPRRGRRAAARRDRRRSPAR